jgi:carboxypeptidase C (cathepsin A)
LNSKAVRQQVIKPHSNRNWYACTNYEYYRLKDANNSMVKYMREHLYDTDVHHFDILIISGTNDSICGTIGTQKWIKSLNLKIKDGHDWNQYFIDGQPKGYMSTYNGHGNKTISLVSVNNGGHEVPLYKPMVAQHVVRKFLSNSL